MIELNSETPRFTNDAETNAWVDWLIAQIGQEEWARRREAVSLFLEAAHSGETLEDLKRSFVPEDAAAYHLFLSEAWIRDLRLYNFAQGARHIPVARALGRSIEALDRIDGLCSRIRRTFLEQPRAFDSVLFEALVAVAYWRARWDVRCVPEAPPRKRHDLAVARGGIEASVECKRKSRVCSYTERERGKWLTMWSPVRDLMKDHLLPWVVEISFRVPLLGLDDDYLMRRVGRFLPLASPGIIADDEELFARVRETDLEGARRALETTAIRSDGTLLYHLLFGDIPRRAGVTTLCSMKFDPREPFLVDDIEFASGAIWTCDAEESIMAKARYLKRELSEALDQMHGEDRCALHWGIDLYDGENVGDAIYERTVTSLGEFVDPLNRSLCVYAHVFEFQTPPNESWALDETCHYFTSGSSAETHLLAERLLIVPEDEGG